MKATLLFSLTLASAILMLLTPVANASATTVTYYMHLSMQTVNGLTAYTLNETATATATAKNASILELSDVTVYYGWRVWLQNNDTQSRELTSGNPVAQVTRNANGSGIQSATWTPANRSLDIGFDAILLRLYMQVNGSGWELKATFIANCVVKASILSSTWTFYTYTVCVKQTAPATTMGYFYWGNSTCNSRVTEVTFVDANVYETINYNLGNGDFITAILTPYTFTMIGNTFYIIILLTIMVPYYNRMNSIKPFLVLFIIFGGTGGVLTLLVPPTAAFFVWLILILALAGTLYAVFR